MLKLLNRYRDDGLALKTQALTAVKVEGLDEPLEYLSLCSKLGFVCKDLEDLQFKKFLFDNEVSLYDFNHVSKYLAYLIEKNPIYKDGSGRHRLVWRALRESDGESFFGDWVGPIDDVLLKRHFKEPYGKIIPTRVLRLMNLIQNKYPEAKFYVSEICKVPDPFAAVDIGTGTMHVFAVWDEPGFSG